MSTKAAELAGPDGLNLDTGFYGPMEHGIVLLDSRDQVIVMTAAAARMLGRQSKQRGVGTLKQLPSQLQDLIPLARQGRDTLVERRIELAGPGPVNSSLKVEALVVRHGKTRPSVLLLLQDLTAAPRAEQNLRQLDRLASVGALSAGVAHEIRNALVVGKTFFDSLFEKHNDEELVGLVRRELSRIDSLVSQILKFTRPGEPAISAVHLHEALNHSLRLVEHQLKDKAILLDRSFAASDDTVFGNQSQLEQAFVNLLLNAIEAMGPHGQLKVATESRSSAGRRPRSGKLPGHLRVIIKDDGVGIPPENMGRLFGPFFTTKEQGSGLGLSITRRILHEHGGVITVKSKPNEGAAFSILLPALQESSARNE